MWHKIISSTPKLFANPLKGLRFGSKNLLDVELFRGLKARDMSTATIKGDEAPVESPKETINGVPVPPEPTHCCNSGCPNCVWIKYAQEMTQLFDNGDVIAKNKILKKVKDPKLRTFLLTSLGLNETKT